MAIRCAHREGVRLLVEVQPVIWSDPQLPPIVDNCEELVANDGEGIEVDPYVHVFGVYEIWKLIVGGLVKSDYLVSQGSHEVGWLIRDGHFELEGIFWILLLIIK